MKTFMLVISVFVYSVTNGQGVKVVKESVRLKGEAAQGFEAEVDGKLEEVQTLLAKYLKDVGKLKKGEEADIISLPLINGKNYTSPLYVAVRDKGKWMVWLGIRPSEWTNDTAQVYIDIKKLVYDFAVAFNREKIQLQIDESLRALQAVERQQQRLVNQHKDYTTRLGENKNEKIQLEKSLENNKIQFEALNKKIEQNKKDQDSVALAGEQIKKVIEMQKQRQRKVN
jgi:hypothetical protein